MLQLCPQLSRLFGFNRQKPMTIRPLILLFIAAPLLTADGPPELLVAIATAITRGFRNSFTRART